MPISLPKFFQKAFAQNGGKQDVPITGDTSGGRASYDAGFPPVTRIPIVAGGIPPFGTDVNGVLYDVSHAIQYVQSGVDFPFNQDFATAIGGYEIGAIVSDESNKSLLWINGTASNTAFPTGWTQFSLNQATESVLGVSRIATQAETIAGTIDTAIVTPKKFVDAFKGGNVSIATNGYQKLPNGLILQWGRTSSFSQASGTVDSVLVTFPIAFPNSMLSIVVSHSSVEYTSGWSSPADKTKITIQSRSLTGAGSGPVLWFAVGH